MQLCQREALHCATLHAGVGTMSGNMSTGPIRIATLHAERCGVTQVHWKRAILLEA
ncbi:DNA-binding transcriptional regulator [Pseudomonas syringae pv. actinidiae]|nr:DNA-binding transcriptional regulator [Pseudomonas syringae pv. actinidiae]